MSLCWPWKRRKQKNGSADSQETADGEGFGIGGSETKKTRIRKFDFQTDADRICSFQEETYTLNFPKFRYTSAFLRAFRYDLQRSSLNPDHGIFVMEESGEVIGFLWVAIIENHWLGERYGYINNIYVVAERRGQGLAHELMEQSEKYLSERGVQEVRLTVTQSNLSAAALYRSCGYEVARWEMGKNLKSERDVREKTDH